MDIFFSEKGNVKRKVLRLSGRGQQTFLAKGRAVSTVGFAAPRARSQLLDSDAAAQKRPWTICKKTSTSVSRLNCLWTMKCEFRMIFTSHKIIFFMFFYPFKKCENHSQLMGHAKQAAGRIWLLGWSLQALDLGLQNHLTVLQTLKVGESIQRETWAKIPRFVNKNEKQVLWANLLETIFSQQVNHKH